MTCLHSSRLRIPADLFVRGDRAFAYHSPGNLPAARDASNCSSPIVLTSTVTSRDIESPYAWARLCASLVLMTIGGSGIYTISVVLPRIQAEFGVTRADA